ncbi:expressed protein [Phakopsora pachyrhizi]|uniref:Expressed protein n=1 Tax=Phakopsora pachyrhizi TaxID=170000 RepID=A0AAV0AXP8_PHAPC|nr:expressed protein [Phakopsora pachyrhizi]
MVLIFFYYILRISNIFTTYTQHMIFVDQKSSSLFYFILFYSLSLSCFHEVLFFILFRLVIFTTFMYKIWFSFFCIIIRKFCFFFLMKGK